MFNLIFGYLFGAYLSIIIKKLLVRLYTVSPANMELYALRLLLLNTAGPTRYGDLKTVDGVLYGSFAKAAEKRGLLESDDNWRAVMRDAVNEKMEGRKLIIHFAQLLYFQPPVDPEQMLDDFLHFLLPQPQNAQDKELSRQIRKNVVLRKVEYYLLKYGSNCVYENILYIVCDYMSMYIFLQQSWTSCTERV